MSTSWLEDMDTEFSEYDDSDAGALFDAGESEDWDAEARSAADRRRARQRRVALARRRQAQARARSGVPSRAAKPSAQQAVSAIKSLDLETKVQEDAFRAAFTAQGNRMNRSEQAAVFGATVNQLMESFKTPDNAYAKAALRFAPLLLLSPQPRGTGIEAFVKDPRVIGAAAVAAITIVGENRNRFSGVRRINMLSVAELSAGGAPEKFYADALDGRGAPVKAAISWESSRPDLARVDPTTGEVTPVAEGVTIITASAEGVVERVRVKVNAAPPPTAPPPGAAPPPAAPPAGGPPAAPAPGPKPAAGGGA